MKNPKKLFPKILKIIRELYSRFIEHGIGYTAGQIAYFFILSVFPFLIFTNALIASFNIPSDAAITFLKPVFPEKVVSFISQYLQYISQQRGLTLLSFGIILVLFSSSKSVRCLKRAFNTAYGTEHPHVFLLQILFSMAFIFIFALIFLVCTALVAFGNDFIAKTLSSLAPEFAFIDIFALWRWATTSLILFFSMSLIYKFIPSAKIKFSEAIPGTIFSIICFLLLAGGFSFYVNNLSSSAIFYGTVGAILLFMLWMYFAGIILILGAELNSIISDIKKEKSN